MLYGRHLGFKGRFELLELAVRQLEGWLKDGYRVFHYSLNRGEDERLHEGLHGRLPGVEFLIGPLNRGFHHPERRLAVLTSSEIYERSYRARARWDREGAGCRARR